MSQPILATKLYRPPPRPQVVLRPRLIERLNEGLQRQLTLVAAPAGFGKTTLVSAWLAACERISPPLRSAWLSLEDDDNEPTRFLAYLVAALQTVSPQIGAGVLGMLQTPQPPPTEAILTALLNDITTVPDQFILVLDDYHVIVAEPVDSALTFLLDHLPPQMHLVVATREDPQLPLARLRARGQLTELRAADLRFSTAEASEFLSRVMGLNLAPADLAALETRTEGWIAGLQLAALSMQGQSDVTGFIQSFTGSHRFVLDYLVEEVLQRQPEHIQTFLLRTSILDRLCGPLCDAVLLDQTASGQKTLESIERANLFIGPLDNDRRWYRYHHLFADLLRRRLAQQQGRESPQEAGATDQTVDALHRRASQWYEDQGLELEAFHHAAAGQDIERAERLIEGHGTPLHYRGAAAPVLNWLESLPRTVVDARPTLLVMFASALAMTGQLRSVESNLQAAEAALRAEPAPHSAETNDETRNLVGHIAAIRALVAAAGNQVETMIVQSQRALEYLSPDNLPVRTTTTWILGWAYQLQGDRAAARRAYTEAMSISQASGNTVVYRWAAGGLAILQETDNQLLLAAQTYRLVLQLAGDPPQSDAGVAHLGLARICCEWNDLNAAQQHLQLSVPLLAQSVDMYRYVATDIVLARLKLAEGDVAGADAILAEADQSARQHNLPYRIPEVAGWRVLALLRQGRPEAMAAATELAQTHGLPLSQARVHLAQGNPAAALAVLKPWRDQVEARRWPDEHLKALVLQAVALQVLGDTEQAVQVLRDALALAEPDGFIRTFVDEGPAMATLLRQAAKHAPASAYIRQLLAALGQADARPAAPQPLMDALSDRELEVLRLLRTDLSGPEMARELSVSLSTLRTHTQNIFSKLAVSNRRTAVRRADELGL